MAARGRIGGFLLRACGLVAAVALAAWALRSAAAPFVWIGAGASGVALLGVVTARRRAARLACLYAAVALLVLTGFELHLVRQEAGAYAPPRASTSWTVPHPLYGVVGRPGAVARVVREHEGQVVFDVHYRLDERGRRRTPEVGDADGCVVFFGGSFTFGDGVEDRETLPSQVALLGAGRRVVNLGMGGAGAQQMLAFLRHDGSVEALGCRPTQVVYTALPHHVYRAAGKPPRYNFGPRYELDQEGRLVHRGQIEAARGSSALERSRLLSQLLKSRLYQRLFEAPRLDEDDVGTWVAIVEAARREVGKRFPGARFDVLLWDDVPHGETALYAETRRGLQEAGLRVHTVPELLPGYRDDRSRYQLHPSDRHPNALAHATLARWIVDRLLGEEG